MWGKRKDGQAYRKDQKVRNISDNGDDVIVEINIEDADELEEFAKQKMHGVNPYGGHIHTEEELNDLLEKSKTGDPIKDAALERLKFDL